MVATLLFGFQFMAITLVGYYAYVSQSLPLLMGFMFLCMNYMCGLWYTLFTSALVITVEMVLHKKELLQFIESSKVHYYRIKQSIKLNKELRETMNNENDFDLGNVNGNLEKVVEYIGETEILYENMINHIKNTKWYRTANSYYEMVDNIVHQGSFREILSNVDETLGSSYDVMKKLVSYIPYVGTHISKFLNNIDNINMVHNQHKYEQVLDSEKETISTQVFDDDESNDILSNGSDDKKNNTSRSSVSFKQDEMESELDELLKTMPEPSSQREREMKKQLELLANIKMPTMSDMQKAQNMGNMGYMGNGKMDPENMDMGKLAGQMNNMMKMMGTLGNMVGQLDELNEKHTALSQNSQNSQTKKSKN